MVQSAAQLQGELIASQSELSGLEQIYSPNNVRVRSGRAKIAELQRQLNNVAGVPGKNGSADGETLYPSIRELPLLGVKYFDLYRKVKVQENVFEALTKQYEVAKVQEAKEIPTVRVLDAANVPERKSFPPRTLIALLGGLLAFLGAGLWHLWAAFWSELNPADPRRAFAHAIFERSHLRGLRIMAAVKGRDLPRSR
jgi:capsule polysaccharide export protein KpsE/RkpR